jgi:hypothetical protein
MVADSFALNSERPIERLQISNRAQISFLTAD